MFRPGLAGLYRAMSRNLSGDGRTGPIGPVRFAGASSFPLTPEIMVPAAGQGMIGIPSARVMSCFRSCCPCSRMGKVGSCDGRAGAPRRVGWILPDADRRRCASPSEWTLATHRACRPGGRPVLLKRRISGQVSAAFSLGVELGRQLRADSPSPHLPVVGCAGSLAIGAPQRVNVV